MTTYPLDTSIAGRISEAMSQGGDLYFFHFLFLAWCILFVMHLRNPNARFWSSKVLVSLSILTGFMGPFHYFFQTWSISLMVVATSGVVDPAMWAYDQMTVLTASLVILLTAMVFLGLSTWAWIMPRPDKPGD